VNELIPALSATIAPAALTLAVAYSLRLQGGRMRSHPVPASQILTRLENEPGRLGTFGDTTRPSLFTVDTQRRVWVGGTVDAGATW